MEQHEREYFVSRIRSGCYHVKYRGVKLKVVTPTIEQEFDINQVYEDSFVSSVEKGLMTEKEMLGWMIERKLWEEGEEKKIEILKKDIEKCKLGIYEAANDFKLVQRLKVYARAGERQLEELISKKRKYFSNTCEGIANIDRIHAFLRICCYNGSDLCDFDTVPIEYVCSEYFSMTLSESQIREICRNDPWKSLWLMNDTGCYSLFSNSDRELSIDQKSVLVWSRMYDNVQESLDCPPDDIINDDDMLDGWFISQRQKREEEKKEKDMDNTLNPKVANSEEVYIPVNSEKDHKRVNEMNSKTSQMIKKQRAAQIKTQGSVLQHDLKDERMRLTRETNAAHKGKFKR